jgi:aminoglycoside phosphotransferase (APT) family kinase protein
VTSSTKDDTAGAWRGLDEIARLPAWLCAAIDPAQVSRALVGAVPELATGAETVSARVKTVRIARDGWSGAYVLTLRDRGTGTERVVALRGTILAPGRPAPVAVEGTGEAPAFGAPGWRAWVPELRIALETEPPDAALPSLPLLTDAERARAMLESCIRAAAPVYADVRIESCAPRIMRYSPGSRCTVLYRLGYPASAASAGWPELVVAKTYKGGKGKHAYEGMRALWDAPFRHTSGVTLAEPLAFLPEPNVLVQGPVPEEQTLQEMMASAARARTPAALNELYARVRQSAAGLAGLHCSEVRFGPVRTWEDEFAEVRGIVDKLARVVPAFPDATAPLLAWLEDRAAECPADPVVATHGTFRPGQVLIHRDRIGFIDFDSFCQGEPALDLSLFFRRTKDIVLDVMEEGAGDGLDARSARATLLALADTVCEVFLGEYEAHARVSRQRIALWEALDLLTLVLHSWTKVKPERLKNATFALEQHLRGLIPARV